MQSPTRERRRAARALLHGPARLLMVLLAAALTLGSTTGEVGAYERQTAPAEDPLDKAAAQALRDAPPRARIGKIRGARILSRIDFDDPEADPHDLSFSAAFPGRSRLALSRDRYSVERFQLGDTWFGLDRSNEKSESDPKSVLLTGSTLDSARFDVAMRRTLFFWPDAGNLAGEGLTRTAKVADIGILIATLDRESGRPVRLRAFGRDGSAQAEFRSISWREVEERWWPSRFELHVDGRRVWQESVEEIEDRWNFTDLWFLPVDRSRGLAGQANEERLRMIPSPQAWVREFPLSPGADLPGCRREGQEALARAQAELGDLGVEVDPRFTVLLNDERQPRGLLVRAIRGQAGEEQIAERPGWRSSPAALTWTFETGSVLLDEAAFEAVSSAAASSGDPLGTPCLSLGAEPLSPITVSQAFLVPEDERPPSPRTP
ncbi:MAG: hypothetical protein P8R43_06255 [Planctomycetota bacterium]|nr:hypothetical protein [Planctomycetota bacterium]